MTRNTFLALKTYHVIQPSGSRTSLRDQCFLCLVYIFVEFCYSVGFGTTAVSGDSWDSVGFLVFASIQTVVIRFCTRFPHSPTVLLTRVPCSVSVQHWLPQQRRRCLSRRDHGGIRNSLFVAR